MTAVRRLAWALIALSAGCGRPAEAPSPWGPPAPGSSAPPLPGWQAPVVGGWSRSYRVEIDWSDIDASKNCYFLSGPGRLGRKTRLESEARVVQRGDQVTLSFGVNIDFVGTMSGDKIALAREAAYDDKGPWTTRETIEGPPGQATYRYEECDKSGNQGCPNRCKIRATVAVRSSTAPP